MTDTTMNTGAASLSDERERAAITACALMIKGICLTTPNAEWTERIENRIHYLLRQIATTPQADAAPSGVSDGLRKLIAAAADCISEAVTFEQDGFDTAPMPATQWDYNADQLAYALRAELAAIAAGGAQEAVGSEPKAETATLILRGELVNVGIDESGIGDMELIVGARGVLLSGLSQEETKALAPFLFQQVTLAVASNGEQETQS